MRRALFYCLCLVVVLWATAAAEPAHTPFSHSECLLRGFDKDVVQCKNCEKLFMLTKSTELKAECEKCCTAIKGDAAEAQTRYAAARIEGRQIFRALDASSMGALAMFYRTFKKEPYFEHLSFSDRQSALYPQIVLLDDDGKEALTLRITGWSPETLHDFLTKKIKVEA